MLDFRHYLPRIAALTLAVMLAHCSGSGGSAAPAAPVPSPSPTASPGAIVFTGSTIVNNVMTLPCATNETFTVSQVNFAGTFTLVDNNPVQVTLAPTSGTSSTVFTVNAPYEVGATVNPPFTIVATGGAGITQTLTINTTEGGVVQPCLS